jgi:hypothetical protein
VWSTTSASVCAVQHRDELCVGGEEQPASMALPTKVTTTCDFATSGEQESSLFLALSSLLFRVSSSLPHW